MTPSLWPLFRQEASEAATRLAAALVRQPRDVEGAASALFALATAAATVRLAPLVRIAHALHAGLHTVPSAPSQRVAEPIRAAMAELAAALPPWIERLRPQEDPPLPPSLEAALKHLEELTGLAQAAPSSAPSSPGAGRAERFVPLVDEEMLEPFFEESQERLESLGQKLLQLERRGHDPELIGEIFRDLHTLKGSSGLVGLQAANRIAHAAEDLVAQLRSGARATDRGVIDALLAALDALRSVLQQAARPGTERTIDVDLEGIVARLRQPGTAPPQPSEAPAAQAPPGGGRPSLRVDFHKLDLLLNLVGELVLGKSRLRSGAEELVGLSRELGAELRRLRQRHPNLPTRLDQLQRLLERAAAAQQDHIDQLDHIVAELRVQVMRLRMVPIGRILGKHHRTVRELGRALGRQVHLEIEGAETELDKLLVEQLDEPLLHLVRNAIDHGLEPAEQRQACGKPPVGLLRLRAWHRGSQILIEVSDDGRGIDSAAVRERAVQQGLLSSAEAAALDEAGVLQLLFRPGFSTAAHISEVSGRGVGLDVVQRAVQRLKGTIEVHSVPGAGTRFLLRLPLTLAIIQVLLVQVRGEVYALPLERVVRALLVQPGMLQWVHDRQVLLLEADDRASGEQEAEVPVVEMAHALGLDVQVHDASSTQAILVEAGGGWFALLCDRLLGKREIVVKSLGELLHRVPCVAGATLIDDRVVLLLDVMQLVQRPPPPRAACVSSPGPSAAPTRRILVVEDSAVEREALCRMLRQGGYEVVAAPDGRAALELVESDPRGFDLVSTDVTMPHLDGYELTRRLRAQQRHRDVPILMLTARTEPLDRVRGFDAGVDEYLTKPVDPALLLRTVARHLAQQVGPGSPRRDLA
ncbi:MAG: response regulator [Myxococcales bacterium]|nr:response regulator [Myxococcota bacterium]MDW8282707.1 response regulator [Myxococcales bacterium]